MKAITFSILSMMAVCAVADELPTSGQTDVYYSSSATAVRSRRKEHPWRVNCIGHDTEWISDDKVKAAWTSTDKSVSQKDLSVDGIHDDIRRHVYETLSYNFEYSSNDTLHLRFSSSGHRTQQNEWSTDCTYTKTQSSVTGALQSLTGKAYLVVPKNVYVVRIMNKKSSLKNLTAATAGTLSYYPAFAKRLEEQHAVRKIDSKNSVLPLGEGQLLYQLVRPGDVLEVNLKIETDELGEQTADLEWDVNFLGNKNCSEVLARPSREFSASQVLALLKTPVTSNQSFDEFVTRTSCLRNSSYIHELMVNSSGKSFAELIEGYQSWLREEAFDSPLVNRSGYQKSVAMAVAQLTLFDLSENLLQDLTSYCRVDELPVLIGLPPAFKALIRGYHSAARTYLKIDYLWQIGRNSHIDLFLQKMKEHEKAHLTYAKADENPDFFNYAKAAQYKLFTDDIRVYESMQSVLKTVPKTITQTRAHAELDDLIIQADSLARNISAELLKAINAYGRRRNDVVVATPIRSDWARLLVIRRQIAKSIRDDLDWFKFQENDPLKTQFTRDLSVINNSVYRAYADLLTDNNPQNMARREIFIKSGDSDSSGRIDLSKVDILSKQVNQCLSSPTEGEQQ